MFFNSLFKQVIRLSRYFPPKSAQVSYAYNTVNISSETLNISLVNIIKRRGHRIDPCGTPHLRKDVPELIPS